jgi:hypothetical protein
VTRRSQRLVNDVDGFLRASPGRESPLHVGWTDSWRQLTSRRLDLRVRPPGCHTHHYRTTVRYSVKYEVRWT